MSETQLTLIILWIALMFAYLLGDVLRIFSGNFTTGEIEGKKIGESVWLGIAILMSIPIFMIIATLKLDYSANRILNIVVAGFFFLFNTIGLPGYKPFDRYLIIVGLIFNVLTIYYAWNWLT